MSQSQNSEAIAVVGAGRVGSALAALWLRAGRNVVAITARTEAQASASALWCETAGGGTERLQGLSESSKILEIADCVVLAVPDDALCEVVGELAEGAWKGRIVLHTSGFHGVAPLQPLASLGAHVGSLHPLQSVPTPQDGLDCIPGSTFAVDGDGVALGMARSLAEAAGGLPLEVPAESRALYHASAVLASNALVALLDVALEAMVSAGIPEAQARLALVPLVRGTVDNVEKLSTGRALTGPAARGDVATVEGHLEALSQLPRPGGPLEPDVASIYALLTRRMLAIAGRAGTLNNGHHRLAKRLLEDSKP